MSSKAVSSKAVNSFSSGDFSGGGEVLPFRNAVEKSELFDEDAVASYFYENWTGRTLLDVLFCCN